jgi:REP element-mobilizing transposase RayT
MAQTYYKVWIHLVWGTKSRQKLLRQEFRKTIFQHIKEKAEKEDYKIDMINGVEDHIHCLLSLNPKFSISEVVNKLKGESSHWINSEDFLKIKFAWQKGFGAFSVSESNIEKVRAYIINQEEHHKEVSFAEEWERLLELHNVEING